MTPRLKRWLLAGAVTAAVTLAPLTAFADDGEEVAEHVSAMYGTFWALIPPVVAIVLALITKEVYSSLIVGIVVGALFWADFGFENTMLQVFQGGVLEVLSSTWNLGILVFDVLLGALLVMMSRSGGSAAFGTWAQAHVKTRVGAQLATVLFGVFIFVDDYFNCLTVGSVMRPVTDSHKISRAKLAYLIDATAAPICIIAPISTWAAAVSGFVEGRNGFEAFLATIPYNFYALLTLAMLVMLVVTRTDYGPMRLHEANARKGDLFTTGDRVLAEDVTSDNAGRGRVVDLLAPTLVLIVGCIVGMLYTGGIFSGETVLNAFANADASFGLVIGSAAALVFTVAYYAARRLMSFRDLMSCLPDGLKIMGPAIIILSCAWTLNTMTSDLGAAEFVSSAMESGAASLAGFLPAVIFLVACGLAFATGTSWGTFGILIPIVVAVFAQDATLLTVGLSACLAGAVFVDHVSHISDTTIMASAGAQCNHINHVTTQLPYALPVAGAAFVSFLLTGFIHLWWLGLIVGLALLFGFVTLMRRRGGDDPEGPVSAVDQADVAAASVTA
jgi:Na+/H+ antiporter NhaC